MSEKKAIPKNGTEATGRVDGMASPTPTTSHQKALMAEDGECINKERAINLADSQPAPNC